MQLKELNGQLIAHTSTVDVIKGEYIKQIQEFLVSEKVSNDLRKHSNYLDLDYWYLSIAKDLSVSDEKFYWEITVKNITVQFPIKGIVKLENNLLVLAFEGE